MHMLKARGTSSQDASCRPDHKLLSDCNNQRLADTTCYRDTLKVINIFSWRETEGLLSQNRWEWLPSNKIYPPSLKVLEATVLVWSHPIMIHKCRPFSYFFCCQDSFNTSYDFCRLVSALATVAPGSNFWRSFLGACTEIPFTFLAM